MALLGSSVDPRLFMQDYSGFTRAADIQAQGMQNLGAAIGQGIKDFGEAREERKKLDAQVKADDVSIESAMKLGESLGIDIKSYLEPIQALRKDPNTTPAQSLALGRAAAQGISNAFTLGIGAQEREIAAQRAKAEAGYKQGMLGAAQTRAAASLFSAKQAAGELKETEISIFDPEIGKERKEKALIDKQGQYYEPDTKRPILNKEKFFYGEEGGLGELPPTSQIGGSASDLIANAQNINILPVGSKIPTASVPYDGRPAPNRYNNPGGAYPRKDLVQFGMEGKGIIGGGHPIAKYPDLVSGAAANMEHFRLLNPVGKTVGQMRKKWVYGMGAKGSLPISGLDENKVITQNDLNDPTFMSKWMAGTAKAEGFKGRMQPEELASAFNLYQAGGYNKNAQSSAMGIDSSLAMGGDMTQQAMGTPEQQAMLSQQIEQGAGMATAQNIPQGAVPTEPSMATQQPQLPRPQRRMVRGIPADGGKAAPTMMTAEQVKNLEGQGFRVSAMPNPDGTFMVSGVTTGGSSRGFEVTTPEGTTVRYGGSGGLAQPKVGPGEQLVPDPTSPTGTRVVQIPGGEAEKASKQEAAAAEAAGKRGTELGLVALAEIDNFIDYTDKMSKLPFASPVRQAFATFGMEEQAEAESSLNTVKSNLKFEALDALRKASPSGASGLGQVTQNEFSALAEQWGDLRLKGNPEKIKERAIRIKKQLLDVVHGSQAHRDSLLKKGSITQQQYNDIQSQYPGAKAASREDENLSRWRKTFIPQPTQ